MPSPRPLVSGRDFQLRYAIHRLTLLALRRDRLHERAARVRLEWPLLDGALWADMIIEDEAGAILELIECKEHDAHLDRRSIVSFLAGVERMPGVPARFVTNARFLDDGSDFAKPNVRERIPGASDPRIEWELGTPSKSALTAECLMLFSATGRDSRELYARLYARLAGQMSARLQREGDVFVAAVQDLHRYLFTEDDAARLTADRSVDAADDFAIDELRGAIAVARSPHARAMEISRAELDCALRRNLFGEAKASLADVFLEPRASVTSAQSETELAQFSDSALSQLFQWVASGRNPVRANTPKVLLITGPFGSGKSSLLTTFAVRLLESGSTIAPILIPLRDLIAAAFETPIQDVLWRYVRDKYGIDVLQDNGEYCLLCDGFDELNLYYSDREQKDWVDKAYRELASLGQRKNLWVVISSRPILLMGTEKILRKGTTRLLLEPFDDEQIAAWCDRYRSAEELDAGFTFEFLAARNLVEVARTPIVLYMIGRVYETARGLLEEKRYTAAEVYRLFVDWTSRGGYVHDDVKHLVPDTYREILQDIAWHIFQSGDGFLQEDLLLGKLRETWGQRINVRWLSRRLFVAHMLQPSGNHDTATAIEFTHQSFREYLVADRIWRVLAGVRKGNALAPEDWIEAHGRPVTGAEIAFLNDMVLSLDEDEAVHLYEGLAAAEKVHTYWNAWARPVWVRGLDAAKAHFDVLPSRAHAQAALALMLRIRAYARLVQLKGKDAPTPPNGVEIFNLLTFADSFGGRGLPAMTRGVILENLFDVRLQPFANFNESYLVGANLSGCSIPSGRFPHANLENIKAIGSEFQQASFRHALLMTTVVRDASFENCDFGHASLTLAPASRINFRGAKFDHASLHVDLEECTLAGNSWKGAKVTAWSKLTRCTLDRAAHNFFSTKRAQLLDCEIVHR